jgi:hypothetical protein
MLNLYLTALVFIVLCLLVSEAEATQPAFAFASVVPTYTVINTYVEQPIEFILPVSAPVAEESEIAESTATTASFIDAPVAPDAAMTKDTLAITENLLATMTKKELLQLIHSNGWYVKAVTSLNKRQLAEAAAERI